MSEILVSVIMPVYGVEKHLPACLDSVLGQSLRAIEVICIDDASPDRCPEILDEYAARDSRVRVIHLPENRQQGFGRNLGLETARGKYVYLLDSDDLIHPETLEELYDLAERDDLDGVFFDSEVIFEEDRFRGIDYEPARKGRYEDRVYSGLALFESFYAADDWNVYVWRQFWRREFLRREGIVFPVSTEHEDEAFSVEAAVLAERVRYLPRRLAIHRYRPDSVMTRAKSARDLHGYFMVFRTLALFGERHGICSEAFEDNLAHLYDLVLLYQPLMDTEETLNRWFTDPAALEEYRLLCAVQQADRTLRRSIRRQWEPLESFEHVYLYGAGQIAQRLLRHEARIQIPIEGFLVSFPEKNPPTLCGRPVLSASDWIPPENSAVVIAVAPKHQGEIAALLRDKDCRVFSYVKGKILGEGAGGP